MQQLNYWDNTQLVSPSIRRAYGRGSHRLYSLDDLVQVNFIRRLQKHGWSIQKIRKAIDGLRAFVDGSQPFVLIHGNGTILALHRTKKGEQILLDALNPGGQQVLEIVLETLVEETHSAVERFAEQVVNNEQ